MSSLRWRAAVRGDLEALTAVVQASELADRRPELTTAEDLATDLDDPDTDPARHTLVVERDGQIVGYGFCLVRPVPGPTHHFAHLFAAVHPDHREVVGDELLTRLAGRGDAALSAAAHDRPKAVRVSAMEWQHDDLDRFARLGFSPIRYFTVMSVEVGNGRAPARAARPALPGSLDATPGRWVRATAPAVRIVPWRADLAEAAHAAHLAGFADHWGSTPTSAFDWRRRTVDNPFFRSDLSFLVPGDSGEVTAYLLCHHYPGDEALTGRREAWISTLGVRPEARGRGVATALLTATLTAIERDPHLTHAGLDVDADSPTGAQRLYARLGFAPLYRSINHARFLT